MKRALCIFTWLLLAPAVMAAELESFTARNHPRASGLNFSIGFPKQWTGRRPISGSVVAAFWTTPIGPGDSMSLVVPPNQRLTLPADVTKDEFRGHFESPALVKTVVGSLPNAKFIRKVFLEDYPYPAGYIDYTVKIKLPDGEQTIQVRNHLVYLGKQMLQVQFYFWRKDDEDALEEFAGLMREVMDSLTYPLPPE
jgi:hypothetical protein